MAGSRYLRPTAYSLLVVVLSGCHLLLPLAPGGDNHTPSDGSGDAVLGPDGPPFDRGLTDSHGTVPKDNGPSLGDDGLLLPDNGPTPTDIGPIGRQDSTGDCLTSWSLWQPIGMCPNYFLCCLTCTSGGATYDIRCTLDGTCTCSDGSWTEQCDTQATSCSLALSTVCCSPF